MYVTNARTPWRSTSHRQQLWKHTLGLAARDPAARRVWRFFVSNKGAAIYNGKVYRTTLECSRACA